jgi:hypothetical protein
MTSNLADQLVCWKCGAAIGDLPMPLGRTAVCTTCNADLHVCRLCEFYDTSVSNSCREPIADHVKEKERANFCDYFQPKANAYVAPDQSKTAKARAQLDALFGETSATASEDTESQPPSAEDSARQELEKLFKK